MGTQLRVPSFFKIKKASRNIILFIGIFCSMSFQGNIYFIYQILVSFSSICCSCSHPWHAEVPRTGIKQQWPQPQAMITAGSPTCWATKELLNCLFLKEIWSSKFFTETVFLLDKSHCSLKGSEHYVCNTGCFTKRNYREVLFQCYKS